MLINEISSLENLREYITKYEKEKGQKSLHRAIQNSKTLRSLIESFTPDETDLSYAARCELIIQQISRPACTVCGEKTNFEKNNRRFLECCSVKCAANNKLRNEKIAKTNLEKYGNENFWGSKVHQENLTKSAQEKFGVDHYLKSDDFKRKSEETSLKKYGTKKPQQSDAIKEKIISSNRSRSLEEKKNSQEKRKRNSLIKHGASHHMQNLEIFEKQQKNSYYFKDYTLPSGKIVRIQGFENRALDKLLETYSENDLVISNSEIFNLLGPIEYIQNGSSHRYFPDIYIPKENLIIEVKSSRTYNVHKEKNLLKKAAVEKMGLKFQFWIYNKDLLII